MIFTDIHLSAHKIWGNQLLILTLSALLQFYLGNNYCNNLLTWNKTWYFFLWYLFVIATQFLHKAYRALLSTWWDKLYTYHHWESNPQSPSCKTSPLTTVLWVLVEKSRTLKIYLLVLTLMLTSVYIKHVYWNLIVCYWTNTSYTQYEINKRSLHWKN